MTGFLSIMAYAMRRSRGKSQKNKGFLSNTGLDRLKNHKTTHTAFIVMPSSALQQNAIKMASCWRADDGPLIMVFVWILFHLKKKKVKVGSLLAKLSGSAHEGYMLPGAKQYLYRLLDLYNDIICVNNF